MIKRCEWATDNLLKEYHDTEWGVPLHNDRKLFEFLILDGAQAGLSWSIILKKRVAYRKAFDLFNPKFSKVNFSPFFILSVVIIDLYIKLRFLIS